jgi:hypothetical protein
VPIKRERIELGKKRLKSVLRSNGVASQRTLEQKISDAGPFNQRIDPHVITVAKNQLLASGELLGLERDGQKWFHLAETPIAEVEAKVTQLQKILARTQARDFTVRVGQALEIAVYKALMQQELPFFGGFTDLDAHDDATLYRKEEPPSTISGKTIGGERKFDFIVMHGAQALGIEVKNIREWMYPDRTEVLELLDKATEIGALPVLIARRIHYSTFSLLGRCGLIIHQTYGQVYPATEGETAGLARQKEFLGYHDIRLGNEPDARLLKFITKNLSGLIVGSVEKFKENGELLKLYAKGRIRRVEFVAALKWRPGLDEAEGYEEWEGGLPDVDEI